MYTMPPTRFWFKDTPGPNGIMGPTVVEVKNGFLTAIYVPKDGAAPEQLFALKLEDVIGRYYDIGGSYYPDSLTIQTKSGEQYSFFRHGVVEKAKNFPESLIELSPEDPGLKRWFIIKVSKQLAQFEAVLKDKDIPIKKPLT